MLQHSNVTPGMGYPWVILGGQETPSCFSFFHRVFRLIPRISAAWIRFPLVLVRTEMIWSRSACSLTFPRDRCWMSVDPDVTVSSPALASDIIDYFEPQRAL